VIGRALLGIVIGIAILAPSTGCSLLFAPDRSLLDRDAGADSGEPDDGGPDAPIDAPDAWTGDGGPCNGQAVELACDDAEDDDCDGLADCDDYDCASSLSCCGTERPIGQATSNFETVPAGWQWMPSDFTIPQPTGSISDFGVSGKPRAIRAPVCLPIELGVRVRATIHADGDPPVCPSGPCENYASIALTATTDFEDGEEVTDDLSVRIYHDGRAETRQNRAVRDARETPFAATPSASPIGVSIDLAPGVSPDDGEAWIYATVVLVQDASTWTAIDHQPIFTARDLLGPAFGCVEARGLLLAFQGIGQGIHRIDNLRSDRFDCANPGHFEPAGPIGTTLDATTLRAQTNWTGGGIGSPTIMSSLDAPRGEGGVDRWDILYDGSNLERTNEPIANVHFSIGGAFTAADVAGLSMFTGRRGVAPIAGDPLFGFDPPECFEGVIPTPPGDCALLRSYREPSVWAPIDEAGRHVPPSATLTVAFAREVVGAPGRFEIGGGTVPMSNASDPTEYIEEGQTLLSPADAGECVSFRDPLLLPTRANGLGPLLLFFTCERGKGTPSTIGVATIATPFPRAASIVRTDLLTPADVGPFARAGLSDPDGAVWFHEGGATYRLWFLSHTLAEATLSFAEGTITPEQSDLGVMAPPLRPYPANPVMTAIDPVLGACASSDCDLESLAVTRMSTQPNRVRLMISRTRYGATTIEHGLVPVEQVWPSL
jgi:hypothetical protein